MINDCMSGNEEACEELEVLYEDFEEEDEEEEEEFDCINSNPNAYSLYISCMNGDEGACEIRNSLKEKKKKKKKNGLGVKVKIWALFLMLFLQLL